MVDVFNNPSNDYIIPGLSPCPGSSDDQFLVWTKDGMTIVRGSEEVAMISYKDLKIPVASFNKQQKILQPGEVSFIQGLTKTPCTRQQGFTIPDLSTNNADLNSFFLKVDLTVRYYKNFKEIETVLTAEGNYYQGITVDNALNMKFNEKEICIVSSIEDGVFGFAGTKPGYDFEISNVELTILDASMAGYEDSPFEPGDNEESYTLAEDKDYDIAFVKYLNSAMQGIVLRGIFPTGYKPEDKWIYLHHVKDFVTLYDECSVEDASCAGEPVYVKNVLKVDVGNACHVGDIISAGDYLNWLTENNKWKKVGEAYIWISAIDYPDCQNKNLVEGFYVYNAQSFPIKIEYLVFI